MISRERLHMSGRCRRWCWRSCSHRRRAAGTGPRLRRPAGLHPLPAGEGRGRVLQVGIGRADECRAAAAFMADTRRGGGRPDAAQVHGYACDIRYWRNTDGDIYASRHACRRGAVAIRFYGMV